MPSSTFSFEPRAIPSGNWGRTWLVAAVIAGAAVWWCERTTRSHGQRTSIVDDENWWAVHRQTVDNDPQVVVMLGTSRLQVAYSAEAFATAAPTYRGVQLAIDGTPAFGVLEDLANDEGFRGIAIVDLAEWEMTSDSFAAGKEWIQRAHAMWRAPGAVVNRYLATLVQDQLAVLAVGGRRLIESFLGTRRWPDATWTATQRDRTRAADYSVASPAALQKNRDRPRKGIPPVSPSVAGWIEPVPRIEAAVQRIRERGGAVAFIHLPMSGKLATSVDRIFPRSMFWDDFAARISAVTIHFRDVPALRAIECPDDMHLDKKDQAAFTRALVEALRAREVLR